MTTTVPVIPPGKVRRRRIAAPVAVTQVTRNSHVRLFVASVFFGLVLAVVTGPQGSAAAATAGARESLAFPRVLWFIGVGVAIFAIRELSSAFGPKVTEWLRSIKAAVLHWTRELRVRLVLEVLLIGFGVLYVTWISSADTWKGGLCIQIGVALLGLELVIAVRRRGTARAARLVAYALVAAYGALAWVHGGMSRISMFNTFGSHVSHYLNEIGAVPHNQALGKFLIVVAAGLALCELIAYIAGIVRARVHKRTARTVAWILGAVLVAYGWATWTRWSQWSMAAPNSIARWLSTHHLITHSRGAGLTVMGVGVVVLAGAAMWLVIDAITGTRGTEQPSIEIPGRSMRLTRASIGRPALMIAALMIALEWPLHMDTASQSNIDSQIMPFVLLALGLNVVIGFAGLLDLGYVAFFAIGAYTAAYFTGALSPQPPVVLSTFWVIPLAIGAAMLAGVLLGTPTLRLRGDYLAIVTLGFGEIIYLVATNQVGITGGAAGAPNSVPEFSFRLITPIIKASQEWSAITYIPFYYLILGVVVISMFAFNSLDHSKVGRSWTAIKEDEIAADSLGINALKYKVMAFAIGASTGGLAGVFLASQNGTLFPTAFTLQISITVVVCVVFGGMGSIPGVIVGTVIVQGLPAYLQQKNYAFYQPTDFILYLGLLLIVMMIFRPQGLIPSKRRHREIELAESGVRSGGFMYSGVFDASLVRSGVIDAEIE